MHYKDGTAAQVGDIVRGRGYNLKYDIVGPVTELLAGDSCNIRVMVKIARPVPGTFEDRAPAVPGHLSFDDYVEAGATKDFELIQRSGWSQVVKARMTWERDLPPV